MQALHAVAYASTATIDFTDARLEDLLLEARRLNAASVVTGVLLFHGGRFMQYFEGREEAMAETYDRILASRRHRDIVELMNQPVEERSFGVWEMGFARPSASELLAMSTARWERLAERGTLARRESAGLVLLKRFWNDMRR